MRSLYRENKTGALIKFALFRKVFRRRSSGGRRSARECACCRPRPASSVRVVGGVGCVTHVRFFPRARHISWSVIPLPSYNCTKADMGRAQNRTGCSTNQRKVNSRPLSGLRTPDSGPGTSDLRRHDVAPPPLPPRTSPPVSPHAIKFAGRFHQHPPWRQQPRQPERHRWQDLHV